MSPQKNSHNQFVGEFYCKYTSGYTGSNEKKFERRPNMDKNSIIEILSIGENKAMESILQMK